MARAQPGGPFGPRRTTGSPPPGAWHPPALRAFPQPSKGTVGARTGQGQAGPFISRVVGCEQEDPRGHSHLPGPSPVPLPSVGSAHCVKEEPQGRLRAQAARCKGLEFRLFPRTGPDPSPLRRALPPCPVPLDICSGFCDYSQSPCCTQGPCCTQEAGEPGALCPGAPGSHLPPAPSALATGPPGTLFRATQAWLLLISQVSTQGALPALLLRTRITTRVPVIGLRVGGQPRGRPVRFTGAPRPSQRADVSCGCPDKGVASADGV